ncbi:MMPL family transporter [Frankia sp. EAN1pec]|uniref:MMPL family transporter n=1 Tax=Parafrankia sp. (strain EAN1pec) TaxID=298653 RepID=UPI0003040CE0
MVVRLAGNTSAKDEGAGVATVEKAMARHTFDHATVVTTGGPALLRDINDYLHGGFLTLGGIALALMAGLLLVAFAVRWRLLPLGVVTVGLVWAFGLAGYLGIPLSVITIAGLPVLLGVGIDFAVQLHSRIEEEVSLDRAAHPLRETLRKLGPALLTATLASVLAFLVLEFSAVPMLRDFGTLLAVGLPVIVIATTMIMFVSLGWRECRSPTPARDYTDGPLARIVIRLGGLPRTAALPLAVLSVAVFVGGLFAEQNLTVQTDPERWVSQNSQVVKDIDQVRERVGASGELGLFVQADDVFNDRTTQYVYQLGAQRTAESQGDLLTASSLPTTIGLLLKVPGTTTVLPTGADVIAGFNAAPCDIRVVSVSMTGTADRAALCAATLRPGDAHPGAFNLVFRQADVSLQERSDDLDALRDHLAPPAGVTTTLSGSTVVAVALLHNFEANRTDLTYYALGIVFVFVLLRHRNLARALLSMAPVLIAVGLGSLLSWAVGLELSPLTAVGGPLVIALCTEFTTLMIFRFLEQRRRGDAPRQAVDVTAARTGRAFMVSALAAIIGILVLALSSLPLLRDFGLVVAVNVFVALLSALVVLPPLLVWADERGWLHRAPTSPDA